MYSKSDNNDNVLTPEGTSEEASTPSSNNDQFSNTIDSTPVNRRRSLHRQTKTSSLNVTNLNNLFDSKGTPNLQINLSANGKSASNLLHNDLTPKEVWNTPRISKVILPASIKSEEISKHSKSKLCNYNEVNVNPYLKTGNRSGDVSSLFFNMKPSSTPIFGLDNKTKQNIDLYMKDSLISVENVVNSFKSSAICNDTLVSEKTPPGVAFERHANRKSKLNNRSGFNYSRFSLSISRTNENLGVYGRIFNRMRKYGKVSANWSSRAVQLCAQLGITIKNGLSSMCYIYNSKTPTNSCCKCEEYEKQINLLTGRIDILNDELNVVRSDVAKQSFDKQSINRALDDVRLEIQQFTAIRSELELLQRQVQIKTIPNCVGAAPAPPPPPPPPLPPLTLPPILILPKSKKGAQNNSLPNNRPAISLDDILKVKLKKPANRAMSTSINRNSTPLVSMDMLREVKLKPTGRLRPQSTSDVLQDTTVSTSPHSSLSRLLNETNWSAGRLKRLRKKNKSAIKNR